MDERFLLSDDLPIRRDAGGALRIGRTRVAAFLVLRGLRSGDSVTDLLVAFPVLSRADVERLCEFCGRNGAEVDAYLATVDKDAALLVEEGRERQADLLGELHRRAANAARVG